VEWEERSRRLYVALIDQPELLEKYCRVTLIDDLQLEGGGSIISQEFGLPEEDGVLAEAFKYLSQEDVDYWERARSSDGFFESTELVRNMFQACAKCVLQNLDTEEAIEPQLSLQ
jgi:hypothetical protein